MQYCLNVASEKVYLYKFAKDKKYAATSGLHKRDGHRRTFQGGMPRTVTNNNNYASKKTESQVDMKKGKRRTFVYYYD